MQQTIDYLSLHAEIGPLPIALTIVCSFLFLKSIYENKGMDLTNVLELMAIFAFFVSVLFSKLAQYPIILYSSPILAPLISSILLVLLISSMYLLNYSIDKQIYESSRKRA